jgi:hypothetical protein
MNYVLVQRSRSDVEKILKDSDGKILALPLLSSLDGKDPSFGFPGMTSAVDLANDSYLCSHYAERDSGEYFIFYFKNKMYEIEIERGMFKPHRRLRFTQEKPNADVMDDVKVALTAAFAVYGDMGFGSEDGVNTVIPVFSEEK